MGKKKDACPHYITEQRRQPLDFDEIVAGMGDFSDLAKHDVALKIWLPEPVKHTLVEISDRSNLSVSEFLRQFLAIHCYGLYAFYQMTESTPNLFKDRDSSGIRFSIAMEEPPEVDILPQLKQGDSYS